ncbi:MAG TPA: prepilin-type N-terminal cleavage/methylation domain-containing protein [Chthoniobacterales bacterium]|nr:prepilin-type N-terminal cleavage/methylation domain-containing protein [Chthoniobacterales bacterium]
MDTNRYEFSSRFSSIHRRAFTLLELIVVIAIIVVLAGLLFPAVQSILDRAKKVQAKNDLTQIVTAVTAFYTEYGKYPLTPTTPADTNYGISTTNDKLFNELRNSGAMTDNTRGIVFMSPPNVRNSTNPRSGVAGTGSNAGQYFDPWGTPYFVRIDTDYDNQVDNPYNANTGAGPDKIRQGAVGWSLGKDTQIGNKNDKNFTNSDDVISWQ